MPPKLKRVSIPLPTKDSGRQDDADTVRFRFFQFAARRDAHRARYVGAGRPMVDFRVSLTATTELHALLRTAGPTLMTMRQMAEVLTDELGAPAMYVDLPIEA